MSERRALTLQFLNELFSLNDGTGELTWLNRPAAHFKNKQAHAAWNTRYAGKIAGNVRSNGYVGVRIEKRSCLAHRLVYAIHHGLDFSDVPPELDHRDNDCTNNRPANLRPTTHAKNLANIGAHVDNTSGYKGVSWEKRYRHWEARIMCNGKEHRLGYFKDPADAHAAYVSAANDLHGEFARAA